MRRGAVSFGSEGKKAAEKSAATIRNAMNKGEEVAEETRSAAQKNYVIASEALRQFNLRLLELARENSDAAFEFFGEVVNAKDLQAFAELWINHARRQSELWSRQAQEITNLGQRITTESNRICFAERQPDAEIA
jgi:hypothetical protein